MKNRTSGHIIIIIITITIFIVIIIIVIIFNIIIIIIIITIITIIIIIITCVFGSNLVAFSLVLAALTRRAGPMASVVYPGHNSGTCCR